MNEIEKNTVDVQAQIRVNPSVVLYPGGDEFKVLIAGNSITRHGVAEELGWYGAYGMAASCEEKDFVHLIMKAVKEKYDASFCICAAGVWEWGYERGSELLEKFLPGRDFDADLIIMRCIENSPREELKKEVFKQEYENFIQYLNKSGKAQVIVTTSFWPHAGDEMIEQLAAEKGYDLVRLGDLGRNDEMKAIGLFAHSGVANHPGDKGMEQIALRILEKVNALK